MTTPFIEDLALVSKNNEDLDEVIFLTEEVDGVDVPVNLTGRTFFGQARYDRTLESDLICDLTVMVYGEPEDGALRIFVPAAIMATIDPVKGYYDILTRAGAGSVDNLYQAPFRVEGGVSKWQD